MIIISDTTPLRYLIEIDLAHILESLFGTIYIPEKVSDELQRKETPEKVRAWMQSVPEWIETREADTSLFIPEKDIHEGEREAIALALELRADVLLCDDRDAIAEARSQGIATVRLYNILERAAERHLLDLPEAIEKMLHTTHYPPPEKIRIEMLERDRQRKLSEPSPAED
jgi:predicted nucleic acid-binding protein